MLKAEGGVNTRGDKKKWKKEGAKRKREGRCVLDRRDKQDGQRLKKTKVRYTQKQQLGMD